MTAVPKRRSRVRAPTLALGLLLAATHAAAAPAAARPAAQPADDEGEARSESVALTPAAAELKLRFEGRKTRAEKVADRLSPDLVSMLNEWAEIADELELGVVVGAGSRHLILGSAKDKALLAADEHMTAAAELVEPLVPLHPKREPRPILALVLDAKGFHSEAWEGLVQALVDKQLLLADAGEHLERHPTGLLMRSVPLFIQPTMDMAGDATSGDDEFRYENELASKTAQCVLTQRAGPMPPNVQWGLGFFAEQRLFGTSYMFNVSGFVSASDHFDWPNRAQRILENIEDAPLIDEVMDESAPGTAGRGQIVTWALLEHFAHARPEALRELLAELSANHRRRDSWGVSQDYQGSKRGTEAAWLAALETLDRKALEKSLKTARSRRG